MAGRWRMSTVQMSFSIMPALVYLFAGLTIAGGSSAITIGTVVAFTTLQTRLLFPIGSLLNVGIDIQTSRALFDRIFEYLDLPVDITERADAVELDAARACAARCASRTSPSATRRTARRPSTASTSSSRPARRPRSSARPARARRRSATSSRACTTSPAGA